MMSAVSAPFCFSRLRVDWVSAALSFHRKISSSNPTIWPREEQEVQRFAEDRHLFGVTQSGKLAALCYLAARDRAWEIGGLVVDETVGRLGIGTMLIQFTLANVLVFDQPWAEKEELIAYVHDDNQAPRKLIDNLGFEFVGKATFPAPPSMKRDAAGNVTGDKFRFAVEGLHRLYAWLLQFNGTLRGGERAVFDLGRHSLEDFKNALREMTIQYPRP
jgi:RimJ/RimL family protein N-acetyltransferase